MPTKRILRRTFAQLKASVWRSEKAALADLKRSGMQPATDEHQLRETGKNRWQIVMLEKPDQGGSREQKVIESLRKKPGTKGRAEPEVLLLATAPGSKRARKAPRAPEPPKAEEPAPEAPAAVEPPAEPAEAPFQNPYAPLPTADGPYQLVIRSSDGAFRDNSVVPFAVHVSKRLHCMVRIENGAGFVVRELDVAAITAAMRQRGRGRPSGSGRAKGFGKSAEAAKLLMRPEGATFQEVQAITEWGISERFVRRLGRAHKAEPEELGHKHWRLIKQDQ